MARQSLQLIDALRATAARLQSSNLYEWGHMGACNCGYLAQEITKLRKDEIHSRAMQRHGDWNEQLNDYCPTSGLPMDDLISGLLAAGLDIDDLKHLERLSDPSILQSLPTERRNLAHNVKNDVIYYILVWAALLETQMLHAVTLPSLAYTAVEPVPAR